jgi:hypothetical protein
VVLNGRGASIFIWNSSDGSVTNFTGPQLIVSPTESTTYTTLGSGLELCNNEANTSIYVSDQITGLEETSGLIISPNPGINEFTIELSGQYLGSVDITIFTIQGYRISRGQTIKDASTLITKINSESWPSGVYLVRISTGTQSEFRRWIKVP